MCHAIERVFRYFAQFSYPPTAEEIHTFLSVSVDKHKLQKELESLLQNNRIVSREIGGQKHFQLTEHAEHLRAFVRMQKQGLVLFGQAKKILQPLHFIPSIWYLGISGSLSMLSVNNRSDIDIFVITKAQTIWQSRFVLLTYKRLLMLLVPRLGRKLCFNLFFAKDGLCLHGNKQSEYIGHELLQLKPIIDKQHTYDLFKIQNPWIMDLFPNVYINSKREKVQNKSANQARVSLFIEKILRNIQMWWLNHKNIKVNDFGAQVWFIQDDYEKNIGQRMN